MITLDTKYMTRRKLTRKEICFSTSLVMPMRVIAPTFSASEMIRASAKPITGASTRIRRQRVSGSTSSANIQASSTVAMRSR